MVNKHHTYRRNAFILWLCLLAAIGCAAPDTGHAPEPAATEDSGDYFRHRWWSYYNRGIFRADAPDYELAIADFREALAQRDGDQRMARTYGMHFLDYFPHRELGIVLFQSGRIAEAEKELEKSIRQYPSAKARYYLDEVRKAGINQLQGPLAPPLLVLDIAGASLWTRNAPVVISGHTHDPLFVARISINGEAVYQEGAQRDLSFRQFLQLPQGRNEISVQATNLADKTVRRHLTVHVDRQGPLITLDAPLWTEDKPLRLNGWLNDPAGIESLRVDGREIQIAKTPETQFTFTLETAKDELSMEARDRLGNTTLARIPIPEIQAKRTAPVLLAAAPQGEVADTMMLASMWGAKDNTPPEIRLNGWSDRQTVYLERIFLDGLLRDESKIIRFTVNDKPAMKHPGCLLAFNQCMELHEGENSIILEAEDEAGNRTIKRIIVERRLPATLQLQERLRLTVFPFEQSDTISKAGLAFQDHLIDALVDCRRFRVVDRGLLDTILEEQKLSRTRLIDPGTRLTLGKLAAAQLVVGGRIIQSRAGLEIVSRVIDTETTDILATEDVFAPETDPLALRELAHGMAIKIHREFPLVQGKVIQRDGHMIITDLGQSEIMLQRQLLIYREKPIMDAGSGLRLGTDHRIVGRARVVQVDKAVSKAALSGDSSEDIGPTHKVITE